VQNLGLTDAVALRYDSFDAENGRKAVEADGKLGANNAVGTLGILAMHYFGENLKVSAVYELPVTATASGGTVEDPKDNLFTLQFQARF
jgi:hypothetical protein